MIPFAAMLVAAVLVQDAKKPPVPPDDDDVPGLPAGEAPPLPERVVWDPNKSVTGKTIARERISLAGLWRFAAVPEYETPVERAEMGWIEMPGAWRDPATKILDARLRATDGLWRGKPVEDFAYGWAERDIIVSQADVLKWISRRIFLVLCGPWARAEVYCRGEKLDGVERDDGLWIELTEVLIYPGAAPLDLRLKGDSTNPNGRGEIAPASPQRDPNSPTTSDAKSAKPGGKAPVYKPARPAAELSSYIGLEIAPSGARVDAIRLRRDDATSEIEATFDLMRPAGWPVLNTPPIRTVPMSLCLTLEDAETGDVLRKLDHEFGTMPDLTRSVAVRFPATASNGRPLPKSTRLRVIFTASTGERFDEPFPIEFRPAELPTATK